MFSARAGGTSALSSELFEIKGVPKPFVSNFVVTLANMAFCVVVKFPLCHSAAEGTVGERASPSALFAQLDQRQPGGDKQFTAFVKVPL